VVLVVGIALLTSFVVVFFSKQYSAKLLLEYPTVDCNPYYANYPEGTLQPFAVSEYTNN
jgi:hypothetical protein